MASWDELEDRELLEGTDRDPEAFAAFYRRHVDRVAGFARSRLDSRDVAADVVAETFAGALVGRRRFDPRRGAAESWLLGIAAHKIQDAKRRGHVERRAQQRCGIPLIEWTDEDLARIDGLGASSAITALDALPEDQRVAITARVLDERDYEQIADELRIPEATARKRVSRGLAALRQRLDRDETP